MSPKLQTLLIRELSLHIKFIFLHDDFNLKGLKCIVHWIRLFRLKDVSVLFFLMKKSIIRCLSNEEIPTFVYKFILKMATAMLAETLDNFQHSTRLIPECRSCTLISSRVNLRTRTMSYCRTESIKNIFQNFWLSIWILMYRSRPFPYASLPVNHSQSYHSTQLWKPLNNQ
jgi:hypothetical protein